MSGRRRPPKRSKGNKRPASGFGRVWRLLFAFVLPVVVALSSLLVWSRLPGPESVHVVTVVVSNDVGTGSLGTQLSRYGLVRQPWLFDVYMRLLGRSSRWESGTHYLRAGMTPHDLADCLTRAPSRPKVQFTIPEGFDQFRIARRLEALGVCTAQDFLATAKSTELLRELSIHGTSVEGYLFPLTYTTTVDAEPRTIIANCVAETRRRIEKLNQTHHQALTRLSNQRGWGEAELLTLASMIEKETPHDEERPIIAGVFFNRLDNPDFYPRRMLQSDPTALYGCQMLAGSLTSCDGNGGKVSPAMLRDAQNPYNTYRHPGLPPGPIANPGETSIAAVLTPVPSDYLYFVAKSGRHVFSRSLAQHDAAIRDSTE